MVDIEFHFDQIITIIQAELEEPLQEVINRYINKSSLGLNSISFLINGNRINNLQETVESFMSDLDKQNKKVTILVKLIEKDVKDKEQVIVESKDIICPTCKEPCRISINNYNIKLYECDNGHTNDYINLFKFSKIQKVNISQIICDICKYNNKGNCHKDEFYICLNCQKNLCSLCKTNHDSTHNIIIYDKKNYICQIHNKPFIKYCSKCKKNLCCECQEHNGHDLVQFLNLKPNLEEKKNILREMKTCINKINASIKGIITKLNEFSEDINKFYEINSNILNSYDNKYLNFQILKNLEEISYNNKIYEQLRKK